MTKNELFEAVVEVAMEMELTDPTDFGMIQMTEETAYRFIASQLLDDILQLEEPENQYIVALSTSVHLLVENFILHQKYLKLLKEYQSAR